MMNLGCKSLVGLGFSTASVGACAVEIPEGGENGIGSEALQVEQNIQNGTNDTGVTGHGHTVRVNNNQDGLLCTGTALRNDIVITARHCIGGPVIPANYTVQAGWDGAVWTQTVNVISIDRLFKSSCSWCKEDWENDDTDVALLRLESPISMDGVAEGAFRSLYPWEPDNLVGETVVCEGAGSSTCDANGNPGNAGSLLSMNTTVSSIITTDETGRYKLAANTSTNQRILPGDSGGSCWVWGDQQTNYRQVFGVNKVAGCGASTTSMILNQTIRPFVRSRLGAYAVDLFTSFDSSTELSQWTIHEPPASSGGPPEWEISGGALREHSDMKGIAPSVDGTGTHILHNTQVIANAQIDTKIYSADDDTGGIVFRYVDDRNYYRLVAFENNGGSIKFERVRDGVVTSFGTETNVGFDWSNGVKLSVISRNRDHWGYVNDQQVVYMWDKAHPDGKVGLHNRLLKDASYVYFAVYHDDGTYPEPF